MMPLKVLTWNLLLKVSMLVDELLPLEEILFAGHTGVVVRLLQAAGSCHEKQASLLQELLRAFHTDSAPRGCVPLFLSLTTSEVCYGATEEEGEGAKTGEAQGAQEGEQSEEVGVQTCSVVWLCMYSCHDYFHHDRTLLLPQLPSTCTAH